MWPSSWKTKFATAIPKCSCPQSFDDLRNISCTLLVSKVMESLVLDWAAGEVAVKFNPFGGVRGCSGSHLIMRVWQKILTNLEEQESRKGLGLN